MAARDVSSAVSDEILDEVWLMMHMAAEMGCSHLKPVPQGPMHMYFLTDNL